LLDMIPPAQADSDGLQGAQADQGQERPIPL